MLQQLTRKLVRVLRNSSESVLEMIVETMSREVLVARNERDFTESLDTTELADIALTDCSKF